MHEPNDSPSVSPVDPARWVREHGDLLFRYAAARLNDRAEAEDLVQETFLAALQSNHRFEHRSKESTWLVGILRHKVLDVLRRRTREASWRAEAESELAAGGESFCGCVNTPRDAGQPMSELEREELFARINAAVRNMPEVMRQVFLLSQIDGLQTDDVCGVLGLTRANVWTLIHRARVRIRMEIQGDQPAAEPA